MTDSVAARRLTDRQREVLVLLADGLTEPVIARRLGVSRSTVSKHVEQLCGRLGARGRLHAVAIAFRTGELT